MFKEKDYDRFKELYKDKNYALAYALGIKHPILQNTPEYLQMERNFQTSYSNAQKLLVLNMPDKAKEQIDKYITVISKRKVLQLIINNHFGFKDFLISYEANDFNKCYDLIDKYSEIKDVKIVSLLEAHFKKILNKSNMFAIDGDVDSLKYILGDLIFLKSRKIQIDKLLKLCRLNQIKKALKKEDFLNSEKFIYLYIDEFHLDDNIIYQMRLYEKSSSNKLAITVNPDS